MCGKKLVSTCKGHLILVLKGVYKYNLKILGFYSILDKLGGTEGADNNHLRYLCHKSKKLMAEKNCKRVFLVILLMNKPICLAQHSCCHLPKYI